MASLPPKIDQRTYEEIVQQIEALAENFTGKDEIETKSEDLIGRIVAQDIKDEHENVIAKQDTVISQDLANQLQELTEKVFVKKELVAEKASLTGNILGEEIQDEALEIDAKKGTFIDEDLAQKLVEYGKNNQRKRFQIQGWKPDRETIDAGGALIRIFARMVKLVSDRLNQVPEKNFLAFLDLIGGQLKPPQPAKVPLTFYLAAGSSVDGLVPAHTQISAPPAEDSDEEIVFETDRELVVTTAQLQAVFVREPSQDKYSDCTLTATGQQDAAFLAFSGDRAIEHSLYISCPEIFALPELKNFHFHLIITDTNNQFQNLELNWSYWDGLQWQLLTNRPTYENNQFTFTNLPILNDSEIEGQTAKWLRAKLTNIDSNISANLPQITNIKGSINIAQSNLIPEVCLFNNTPLDLSKDFYPFGEQPQVNDTFYIALHDSFIKPNATITIDIKLTHIPVEINNLQITWEIGNGQEWKAIADNNNELRWLESPSAIQFTESDSIQEKLQFPERGNIPSPSTVNGETRYWIRARITKGHYGKAGYERKYFSYDNAAIFLGQTVTEDTQTITVDNLSLFTTGDIILLLPNDRQSEEHEITGINSDKKELTLKNKIGSEELASGTRIMRKSIITETISPTYDPPLVKSLKLTYNFVLEEDAIYCAENDFNYSYPSDDFRPFTPTIDEEPTLYLGFDKSFDNKTVTLYAQVEPPLPDELATDITTETFPSKPELVWEYSSALGWQTLGVQDETEAFSQSGLIQFIAPADLSKRETFGQELYWLRVRWQGGNFLVLPRLRRILTNTMWAVQAITLKEEVLGSSNSDPNQVFLANNTPILLGQQLEVQEGEIPSELASDRVTVIQDELGEIESVWVKWLEVADFYGSGESDRHYILDRQTGEIRFGDGIAGMIPPRGRNNIRLSFYRTGGGEQGNVSSQTVSQLKTTIPYIDRVINLEAAAGGATQEDLERLKARVPKQLRHRDRAVTLDDIADLAYEASTDVARVKVVTPDLMTANFSPLNENLWLDPSKADISFEDSLAANTEKMTEAERASFESMMREIDRRAGQVKVIVLPQSSDRQPVPSLALLEQVETYIRSRCQPTMDLVVTAPKWQEVTVTTTITPVSLEGGDILRNTIKQSLEDFLHPLTGGTGSGWQFGRYPQKSDFYAIIQSIAGVDHVNSLELEIASTEANSSLSADALIYSGNHVVNLRAE